MSSSISQEQVAATVMHLAADYAKQTLDELSYISNSDSNTGPTAAEMAEVSERCRRIERVVSAVEEWDVASKQQASKSCAAVAADFIGSPAATEAVKGLYQCLASLSAAEVDHSASPSALTSSTQLLIHRIPKPMTLAEAALEVMSANNNTFFRKSAPKQTDAAGVVKRPRSELLGADEKKEEKIRLAIYSARTALLPHVDAITASSAEVVSPAVRNFSVVNVNAERRLLRRSWWTLTKARLLQDMPKLHGAVQRYRDEVQFLFVDKPHDAACFSKSVTYFSFPAHQEGVVRVMLQNNSLAMDLTYDPQAQGWRLLPPLHWNICVPTLAMTSDVLTVKANGSETHADTNPSTLRRIVPNHAKQMVQYIQKNLTEGGLDEGCIAANRLLSTIMMDTIAHQVKQLQQNFFVSALKDSFSADIRQGTHVALHIKPPAVAALDGIPDVGDRGLMLMKFYVAAGTVVLDRTWSSKQERSVVGVLTESLQKKGSDTVVDVEKWLWSEVTKQS